MQKLYVPGAVVLVGTWNWIDWIRVGLNMWTAASAAMSIGVVTSVAKWIVFVPVFTGEFGKVPVGVAPQ